MMRIRTGTIVILFILSITFHLNANIQSSPIVCENNMLKCNAEDLLISELERLLFQECGIRSWD
jgi:hypothetical protein